MRRRRIDWAEFLLKIAVALGLSGMVLGFISDTLFLIFLVLAMLSCVTSLGLVINRKDN